MKITGKQMDKLRGIMQRAIQEDVELQIKLRRTWIKLEVYQNIEKQLAEHIVGFPLKSEYTGSGSVTFNGQCDGTSVLFYRMQICKQVGTKTETKMVEKVIKPAVVEEIEPAETEMVEEIVEVPIWECGEGEQFEG